MQLPTLLGLTNFELPADKLDSVADIWRNRFSVLLPSAVTLIDKAVEARTLEEQRRIRLSGTWAHNDDFIGTVVGLESNHLKPETAVMPEQQLKPPTEQIVEPRVDGLDVSAIRARIAGIADQRSVAGSAPFIAIPDERDLMLG